jgi:hypothetical protein
MKTARNVRAPFIFFLVLGIFGVPRSSMSRPGEADQSKSPDGIRKVNNPLLPRDGVQTLKYAQEWSVGGESDPRGELINEPFDIRVGKDGTVFVLDWGDVCIRVFDARGRFLRRFGRKGQGPGDFDIPAYFDIDSANNVFLIDGRSLRVNQFDKEGKPVGSRRIERFCAHINTDAQGRLFLGEESSESAALSSEFKEMVQKITIIRTDREGRNPLSIGPFIGQKFLIKAHSQGSVSLASPTSAITGWGVAPDGRLLAGYNGAYEISVYDSDGKALFRFGREYKPMKIKAAARPIAKSEEFYPAFVPDFVFDDDGNVWLRMYRDEADKEFRYDVFSPDGIYLRQVVAPFRIYRIRNKKAYAIVENEEGFKMLRCYRFE